MLHMTQSSALVCRDAFVAGSVKNLPLGHHLHSALSAVLEFRYFPAAQIVQGDLASLNSVPTSHVLHATCSMAKIPSSTTKRPASQSRQIEFTDNGTSGLNWPRGHTWHSKGDVEINTVPGTQVMHLLLPGSENPNTQVLQSVALPMAFSSEYVPAGHGYWVGESKPLEGQ